MKENAIRILSFAEVCAYALGAIGGFGWSIYGGGWLTALAVLVLAVMAFPELVRAVKRMQR